MTAGFSKLIYAQQPEPEHPLVLDNSYYLIHLYQAQAYFPASPLVKPAFLTLSSSVESPFQPGQSLKSLYQVTTFRKNQPFGLPIGVNLTTFLPARPNDSIRLTLRYIVTRDNPFQKLAAKMKEVNLVSKISAFSLEWGTAVKVSEIAGNLLSFLLQEGGEDTVFELYQDINISDLKAGYWVIYGSRDPSPEPGLIEIYNDELRSDAYMDKLCYAVFRVYAIPRLREEASRERSWWQLLQAGRDNVVSSLKSGPRRRDSALREWESTLLHVRELARKDQSFLFKEMQQIIGKVQKEIDLNLQSDVELEVDGTEGYPEIWREILGVSDRKALDESIRNYQTDLELTKRLLKTYVSET